MNYNEIIKRLHEPFTAQEIEWKIQVVEFANSSGMSTCLEGVETEELQNYLRKYQATWFQGYYSSRPIEIRKFWELVQSGNGAQ